MLGDCGCKGHASSQGGPNVVKLQLCMPHDVFQFDEQNRCCSPGLTFGNCKADCTFVLHASHGSLKLSDHLAGLCYDKNLSVLQQNLSVLQQNLSVLQQNLSVLASHVRVSDDGQL